MTTSKFAELGVSDELVQALQKSGIENPFPIQALTIPDAIAGRDICGKAKTGSGKTLAFGLPMLMRTTKCPPLRPASLVIVPTRELAVQVTEVLEPLAKSIGLRIGTIYGGADIEQQTRALKKGLDIVVATPGRLIDMSDRGAVTLADVKTLVVDEADRMADMGFMPQVEWLLRHMTARNQTLLFSATLDNAVDLLVKRYLTDPAFHEVTSENVTVDQMQHFFFKVHQMDKAKVAASIVSGSKKAIFFARTKRGVDQLTKTLREENVAAAAIHGDLRQGMREKALMEFTNGKVDVLVATDVAARGLDIDGVDVVVHYDPPLDHKAYLHRSGRTARAGEAGMVVTLLLWDEERAVEQLQKRLGLRMPSTEIFSNDKRLLDLSTSGLAYAAEEQTAQ